MREWWADTVKDYALEAHHLTVLTHAAEAWDRAEQARLLVDKDGLVQTDRFGQVKPHPAVAIERDSRTQHARLIRELDLDADAAPAMPTRRGSRYR